MEINSFTGKYSFLSNFAPCLIYYPNSPDGAIYPSVEHAYQAAKTDDSAERTVIRLAPTPGAARRLGRKVTLRPDWEEIKTKVMLDLLRQKFGSDPYRSRLIGNSDAHLVEGNYWHDQTWGDCYCLGHSEVAGANLLGELIEQVRAEVSSAESAHVDS